MNQVVDVCQYLVDTRLGVIKDKLDKLPDNEPLVWRNTEMAQYVEAVKATYITLLDNIDGAAINDDYRMFRDAVGTHGWNMVDEKNRVILGATLRANGSLAVTIQRSAGNIRELVDQVGAFVRTQYSEKELFILGQLTDAIFVVNKADAQTRIKLVETALGTDDVYHLEVLKTLAEDTDLNEVDLAGALDGIDAK